MDNLAGFNNEKDNRAKENIGTKSAKIESSNRVFSCILVFSGLLKGLNFLMKEKSLNPLFIKGFQVRSGAFGHKKTAPENGS